MNNSLRVIIKVIIVVSILLMVGILLFQENKSRWLDESWVQEHNYQIMLEEEDKKDQSVADILVKYTRDGQLGQQAVSVKMEDKIIAMKVILDLLENKKTDFEEKEILYNYLGKYSPYAGNDEIFSRLLSLRDAGDDPWVGN